MANAIVYGPHSFSDEKLSVKFQFGNETYFMSFVTIIATGNGTEGSNFHVWNKTWVYDHEGMQLYQSIDSLPTQ